MTQAVPLVDLALSRRLQPVTPAVLETLETFFTSRASDTFHEVSPFAGASASALLNERASLRRAGAAD